MQVDNLLDDRTHTVATIHNLSAIDTSLHKRSLDILQISNARNTVFAVKHAEQRTMDGRKHHTAAQRCAYHGTLRQHLRQGTVGRYQHIAMEHGIMTPGMANRSNRITLVANQAEQSGIL